jgi:large subunit ribosomal protein L17
MRHRKAKYQLNRFTSWRRATLISLAKSVLIYQSIRTTKTKAKAVRPLVERIISLGKENTLNAKRQAYKILGDHKLVSLLFSDIAARFNQRVGGYTRIMDLGARRGDNAEMVVLELTEIKKKEIRKPKKEKEEKPEEAKGQKPQVSEEKKPKADVAVKEKPPIIKKPAKKFLGGIRSIFKKERDAL